MIKSQLTKAFLLGLCMSALATGTAFAGSLEGSLPTTRGAVVSDELNDLYAKQKEIDQYVFVDHVKELDKKGILVNYTGVVDSYVEIGISPFNDENAKYFYDIFGKDEVKVVAFDQAVIYASGVATDVGVAEPANGDVYTTLEAPDATVTDADAADTTTETKVYKEGEMSIQIESTDGTVLNDNSGATDEALAATTGINDNIQTLTGSEESVVLKSDATKEDTDSVSAPMAILAIAGGAAVIGGVIITTKKKASK
jgi:hypothetical protein